MGNSVHVTYVSISRICSDRLSCGCCTLRTTNWNSVLNEYISAMNSRHETVIDSTRTQYMLDMSPNAPARSIKLFTSDAFHTSHDALIKPPSSMSSLLNLADISARPVNFDAMRSNVFNQRLAPWWSAFSASASTALCLCATIFGPSLSSELTSPPRMDSPLTLTGPSSSRSSKPRRETRGERTSPTCRVMMHRMATLLIISVDVTGHTAMTRMALYSSMPSLSDRTCGMRWKKSRV
mmetsp:Transcript_10233/g.42263  ORF Transcript_10233/g.42263 Transcript_10233/m.42263 type:complete len:237 (-) Transcript_10233:611-1321(-)